MTADWYVINILQNQADFREFEKFPLVRNNALSMGMVKRRIRGVNPLPRKIIKRWLTSNSSRGNWNYQFWYDRAQAWRFPSNRKNNSLIKSSSNVDFVQFELIDYKIKELWFPWLAIIFLGWTNKLLHFRLG